MLLSKQLVMVVEDDVPLRDALVDMLELSGAGADNVRPFANGAEALAFLQEANVTEAIVICDLAMPDVNGFQFYKKVQTQAPDLKFVFITAYELMRAEKRLLRRDGLDILNKPFTMAQLVTAIEKVAGQI